MPEESRGRHARRDEPDDVLDAEVLPSEPFSAGPVLTGLDSGYTASGVPTFDSVRAKIETRYGASLGGAELDAETPEGRSIEEQYEARHKAGAERLAQIRAEMHPDQAPTGERGKA
ncbi:hypothetical protein [Mycolicibacterium komossense]|uniref:35 kDa protein n=1 Tax=Mycolicibacterium komossense TaxID=1779 RepID=A0ABT3CB09_9MYCO|nr:hypothetical protein [Mycolicibacterium komossense]MCV7226665.1 hypothetical protein [Mycolicibacterium komossense]